MKMERVMVNREDDKVIELMKQSLLCQWCTFDPRRLYRSAEPLIRLAVKEDTPNPELIDARLIVDRQLGGKAIIRTNADGIFAGGWLIYQICYQYSREFEIKVFTRDGSQVHRGESLAEIEGFVADIVTAERVLLNFLSRLSGIATLTYKCVRACEGTNAIVTDTRKTLPGYRFLDKYAVQCGGGVNHRLGLCDGVMIKDNHISALKEQMDIAEMVKRIRSQLKQKRKKLPIWVEVDKIDQLGEALNARPDVILLDNMTLQQLRTAVRMRNEWFTKLRPKLKAEKPIPLLEASGGIDLSNIADVARTGVDRIAVGAITHSAPALDLTLELVDANS